MKVEKEELLLRYETVKYILSVSYSQLERYDAKTNQLLTILSLDFTVFGIFTSLLFDIDKSFFLLLLFTLLSIVNTVLIIISFLALKRTLSPHLSPVDKKIKNKKGMFFFKDIINEFSQEEYVSILLGNTDTKESTLFNKDDDDRLIKGLIEDCANDIYEQSKILDLKSKYIKEAYNLVFYTTAFTLTTVVITSILLAFNL